MTLRAARPGPLLLQRAARVPEKQGQDWRGRAVWALLPRARARDFAGQARRRWRGAAVSGTEGATN